MTKIIITILIILIILIILLAFYLNYIKKQSPSIIHDTTKLDNSETELSNIQKKVNEIVAESIFNIENCNELIIQKYDHAIDKKPKKEFIIKDANIINDITNTLKTLPEEGDIFKSFTGNISYILLTFICDNNKNAKIEIYGNKLKTPKTSFFSSNRQAGEKIMIDTINKLIKSN